MMVQITSQHKMITKITTNIIKPNYMVGCGILTTSLQGLIVSSSSNIALWIISFIWCDSLYLQKYKEVKPPNRKHMKLNTIIMLNML